MLDTDLSYQTSSAFPKIYHLHIPILQLVIFKVMVVTTFYELF